jgi:hypothetical protein
LPFLTRYNVNAPYETDEYEYNNFVFQYESGLEYEQPDTVYGGVESIFFYSLTYELNRLAGISDIRKFLAEQGAANVWAGTEGLALLGALNQKAEPGRLPLDYKGLNAVCNEIAGTEGLEAIPALRSIQE